MKNPIFILAIIVFLAGITLNSCQSSAKKVENARNNVIEANKVLDNASKELMSDIENFRKETENKITANNHYIAEFKVRLTKEKKEKRARYEKKLAQLEQKNNDLKKQLDEYQAAGKDKWTSFKSDFNRDMDELGKALKNFYYQ